MASPPVIAVIGSLNADLVMYTPYIPKAGETMTAHTFHTGLGGKGANQAVACAKLSRTSGSPSPSSKLASAVVRMIGAVGNDTNGRNMLEGLAGYGVDASDVTVVEGVSTGVAIILVEDNGENRILLSAGANHTVTPDAFEKGFPGPKPDMIIMQLEIPMETVLKCLIMARRENIPVILNPAPAQAIPAEHLKGLEHIIVNETEAMIMTGCDESLLKTAKGLEAATKILKDAGVQNVVITLGGQGVFYSAADGTNELVPAEKVQVVDTTAAGDTFVAVYALEIAKGSTLGQAVLLANKAASKTVQKKGAQESIPWLDEL
ncbi:putative ribokinase [Ceratocystis lukuohia]|uniref:Ribokinase n=1 Tax=Ceratocystis lukuohia TaxID=2019550 RepID=A0ABR4MJI7_9PEZI